MAVFNKSTKVARFRAIIGRDDRATLVISGAALLFFLPFAPRFFVGDDWLWLAEAIRTLRDPWLLLERNIYGYSRPLSLAMIAGWSALAGGHAFLYSGVSLTLHSLNVWLLYRVATGYGADREIALTAAFLSAFYYLNAPAIAWISVTPDLIVTALALMFLLQAKRYMERRGSLSFLLLVALGLAALLTKESGFVCLGLFGAVVWLEGRNAWTGSLRRHVGIMVVVYSSYLIYYFATRTLVDKEIVLGWSVLTNLWYLLAYALFPLSRRIAEMVPDELYFLLLAARLLSIAAVPVLIGAICRYGRPAVKIFLAWSVLFVATISFFQWDVSLISLYPERTASRYMYSTNFGFSIMAAWVMITIWRKWLRGRRPALILIGAIYAVGNFGVVHKITQKYRLDQATSRVMYDAVVTTVESAMVRQLRICVPKIDRRPSILNNTTFIEGMILVGTGREVEVIIDLDCARGPFEVESETAAVLLWDDVGKRLVVPGY